MHACVLCPVCDVHGVLDGYCIWPAWYVSICLGRLTDHDPVFRQAPLLVCCWYWIIQPSNLIDPSHRSFLCPMVFIVIAWFSRRILKISLSSFQLKKLLLFDDLKVGHRVHNSGFGANLNGRRSSHRVPFRWGRSQISRLRRRCRGTSRTSGLGTAREC